MERRVRRPVTEEELLEDQIADELAGLPDDEEEALQDEPAPIEQQLGRRRRYHEEEAEREADEEEDIEPPHVQQMMASELRKRRRTEGVDGDAKEQPQSRLAPPPAPPPVAAHADGPKRPPPPSAPPPVPNTKQIFLSQKPAGANLFAELPAPSKPQQRPVEPELTEDQAEQKQEESQATVPQAAAPAPDVANAADPVAAALKKITSHISNPSKFAKASPLLRQLIDSGTLSKQHRAAAFEAARAVFSLQPGRLKHLVDPMNRREVTKLMTAFEGLANNSYFKHPEKAQILQIYHFLGITCNSMQTDDSFAFSKVLAKIREAVNALPEIDPIEKEYEQACFKHVVADSPGTVNPPMAETETKQAVEEGQRADDMVADKQELNSDTSKQKDEEDDPFGLGNIINASDGKAKADVDDDDDDDPFGLGTLIQDKPAVAAAPAKPKAMKPAEPPSTAWGHDELTAARRWAVMACVQHAKTFHKHAWAQTGIELLAEHCWKHKCRFSSCQHGELDELWSWVRQARSQRKIGPSSKELNRDTTSFERARAEWSKATVSHRGKVGSQGDSKTTSWLG